LPPHPKLWYEPLDTTANTTIWSFCSKKRLTDEQYSWSHNVP
jgi:hypothetical protein